MNDDKNEAGGVPDHAIQHKKLPRWRRRLNAQKLKSPGRRRFLLQGAGLLAAGTLSGIAGRRVHVARAHASLAPLRPPSASADDETFQAKCIRCGLCGIVCENGCIRFYGLDENEKGPMTPFLDPRARSCTLCMRCTQVCPSGALTPIEATLDAAAASVDMGVARVDPDLCLSYLGRVCGYCHDACPLPNRAIRLVPPASPVVIEEGCVGCGRCVEYCPQTPTAISIIPSQERHHE